MLRFDRVVFVCLCSMLIGLLWAPLGFAGEPKVLVIGIDGLRPDAMERAIERGFAPNLSDLIDRGTYCPNATASDLTFSGPGWSDFLYGMHRDVHRVETNSVSGSVFSGSAQGNFPDLLRIVKDHDASLRTARWTTWQPLSTTRSPGGTDYNFFRPYSNNGDALATDDAVAYLTANDPDVCFFYYGDVDISGHRLGFHPDIAGYLAEISSTDALLGELLGAVRARPGFVSGDEDWLFVVGTDHGGNLGRGHSGNRAWDRETFLIVSGGGAFRQTMTHGAKNVDVVPTALAHLGIEPPEHVVGHPIGLVESYYPPIALGTNLIFNGDAEFDHGFRDNRFDQTIAGWDEFTDADFVDEESTRNGFDTNTVIEYNSPGGFPLRRAMGPPNRGDHLFAGSARGTTTSMFQTVHVEPLSGLIDGGGAEFVLTGYFGGSGALADRCELSALFRDHRGVAIDRVVLPTVTAADRNSLTILQSRTETGRVPAGTRSIEVTLTTVGEFGFADNLSLVIREGDRCAETVAFDAFDGLTMQPFTAANDQLATDFANVIPGWTIDNSRMASPSLELAYDGVTAMDVDSWIAQQGGQIGRGSGGRLGVGTHNTALIFDSDAWHDFSDGETFGFDSSISRTYDLTARDATSVTIEFAWEFATEVSQQAVVDVSFDDGATWQVLLQIDSDDFPNNTILSETSRFEAFDDFVVTSNQMTLRFRKRDATNNWWFAVDNVTIEDATGLIEREDFEGLDMQPFSSTRDDRVGDGTDFAAEVAGWTIDRTNVIPAGDEAAYRGWTALDVASWVEQRDGEGRSIFLTLPENVALVADPDGWREFVEGNATSYDTAASRTFDLRGFDLTTLSIAFDYEFRGLDQQRGFAEISFDDGETFDALLTLDPITGDTGAGDLRSGMAIFMAPDDFVANAYDATIRFRLENGCEGGWFAIDHVSIQAVATTCLPGDANGDGVVNLFDIDAFAIALFDPDRFREAFPNVSAVRTLDFNGDGLCDVRDIDGFVTVLFAN